MLVQSLIIGATALTLHYVNREPKDLREIREQWETMIMAKGEHTKLNETFLVTKVTNQKYGYSLYVNIPHGKSYEELEKLLPQIKTLYGCQEIEMEWIPEIKKAYIQLITTPLKNLVFEPIKTKPNELYFGYAYDKHLKIDMNQFPNAVISGTVGTGKSRCMYVALTNLLHNHTSEEIEVNLIQVGEKYDLADFVNAEQVRGYAETLKDTNHLLNSLVKEMDKRNRLFSKFKGVHNIYEYNKGKRTLPYVYIFCDEFSLLMPEEKSKENDNSIKGEIVKNLKKLIVQSRSAGIFFVASLQRPDKESMQPIFKAMLNVKIAFRQNNGACALVVLDDYEAMKLPNRVAIIEYSGQRYKIQTPDIDSDIIQKYIIEKTVDNKVEDKVEQTTWKIVDVTGELAKVIPLHEEETKEEKPTRRRRRA